MGIGGPRLSLRMSPHVFRTLDFRHEASFPRPYRLQPNGIEGAWELGAPSGTNSPPDPLGSAAGEGGGLEQGPQPGMPV